MQVDLRSGVTQIAAIDTALIYLVRTPEAPLLVSATMELTAPIAFGPDGRLTDPTFETAIGPEGTLGAEVAAINRMADESLGAVELVVEPALLDQLNRMADGYERADGTTVANGTGPAADAATLLTQLRHATASPTVHVTAMPFAGSTMPSLLASGLAQDLPAQLTAGRDMVRQVLGIEPGSAVVRPPAGALDDAAVEAITSLGASTILGNADTMARPPQPNGFASLPTASLDVDGRTVALVLPDPGTQALLAQPAFLADPVRAAQATLGELATIWREQPVPSAPRGIAISLPAGLPRGSGARSSDASHRPRSWGLRAPPSWSRRSRLQRPPPSPFPRPIASRPSTSRRSNRNVVTCSPSSRCSCNRAPSPTV